MPLSFFIATKRFHRRLTYGDVGELGSFLGIWDLLWTGFCLEPYFELVSGLFFGVCVCVLFNGLIVTGTPGAEAVAVAVAVAGEIAARHCPGQAEYAEEKIKVIRVLHKKILTETSTPSEKKTV